MLRTGISLIALLACLAVHPFAQQSEPASKPDGRAAAKPPVMVNLNTASAAELTPSSPPRTARNALR